ncbi:MAG TPA: 30S ribosomal protein S13 [Candidatus Portnoybacteria bacterium]|jgi:small subunit ribosomal protein S13|nr:30S ribosomal protein S13 [Candidatus Portnoybacteria bacterium]MDD5752363.1 30S ribosomal protein S13 [Candidatus Portnoybacteria bacterium]HNU96953.1 30S ribosomal protein S13 [Candidatus Portnoybacteria bacterium]HOZ16621.1 30S ribosomal protein S13 [Candidatus Portnoybacteria bacterium]HPH52169.1 30S ribosomal protein S13 [Candidatus Portnoybacteria bacterium]
MLRIAGIIVPDNKRISIALTYIYGIGPVLSKEILVKAGIDENIRTKDLNENQSAKLREIIEGSGKYKIEGDLRREKMMNIKRLKEIGCYRGIRHIKGLPVRGQNTKTNNRTVRGNKRQTMGSGRKKSAEKT